jgi:hypothetical protein
MLPGSPIRLLARGLMGPFPLLRRDNNDPAERDAQNSAFDLKSATVSSKLKSLFDSIIPEGL